MEITFKNIKGKVSQAKDGFKIIFCENPNITYEEIGRTFDPNNEKQKEEILNVVSFKSLKYLIEHGNRL